MVIMWGLAREERARAGVTRLGVFPPLPSVEPLPFVGWLITGVSRDNTGAVLPSCVCTLFSVGSDALGRKTYTQVDQMVSDATTGAYSFSVNSTGAYRVTFDLAGSPIRAGLTLDTLVGV